MRVVIALGGHAVTPRRDASGLSRPEALRQSIDRAVASIARIASEHEVVVTHGNGPQVGWLAGLSRRAGEPAPGFDVLGAESEGWLGYLIEQALDNALPGRDIATLLTQVEVGADDPGWKHPTKPIGPLLDAEQAERLRGAGAVVAPVEGGLRQHVASPKPRAIVEIRTLRLLMRLGVLVVCAGGGGIPVLRDGEGRLHGAPSAVVDKDLSSSLLGIELEADRLLLLTDVDGVYADWPASTQRIATSPPHALVARHFDAGSMGPKVEAARHFVQGTGGEAMIGAVEDARALLEGEAGTRIAASASERLVERPPA